MAFGISSAASDTDMKVTTVEDTRRTADVGSMTSGAVSTFPAHKDKQTYWMHVMLKLEEVGR